MDKTREMVVNLRQKGDMRVLITECVTVKRVNE